MKRWPNRGNNGFSTGFKRSVIVFALFLIAGGVVFVQHAFQSSAVSKPNDLSQYCPGSGCVNDSGVFTNLSNKYSVVFSPEYQRGDIVWLDRDTSEDVALYSSVQSMAITDDAFVLSGIPARSQVSYYRSLIAYDFDTHKVKWRTAAEPYLRDDADESHLKNCLSSYNNCYNNVNGNAVDLGHMNDMTFVSSLNEIVVADKNNRFSFRANNGQLNTASSQYKLSYQPRITYFEKQNDGTFHNADLGTTSAYCKAHEGETIDNPWSRVTSSAPNVRYVKANSNIVGCYIISYVKNVDDANIAPYITGVTYNAPGNIYYTATNVDENNAANDERVTYNKARWSSNYNNRLITYNRNDETGSNNRLPIPSLDMSPGITSNRDYLFQLAGTVSESGAVMDTYGSLHAAMIFQYDIKDGNFVHAYFVPGDLGELEGIDFGPDGCLYFMSTSIDISGKKHARVYKVSDVNILKKMGVTKAILEYDANGGTGVPDSSSMAAFRYKALPTTVPTRTGYTFAGYSTKNTSNETVTLSPGHRILPSNYTISEPGNAGRIKLKAVWEPNSNIVSFNANGGTGAPGNQTFKTDTPGTLSSTKPTRDGYDFLGWSKSKTATSATYTAGQSNVTFNEKTTLYAIWKEKTVKVSYNINGGSGQPAAQTFGVVNGGKITTTKPTRSNYVFRGWARSASASSPEYSSGQSGVKFTANTTLFAVWAANLTIKYDANGGSGAPGNQTFVSGVAGNISSTEPTRANYAFKGWAETKSTSEALYVAGQSATFTSSKTLYAVWQEGKATVSYDANGGTGAPASHDISIVNGGSLSTVVPTRASYGFLGWAESKTAKTATYQPGATVKFSSNKKLYAVWQENTIKVTYNANGGEGAPAEQNISVVSGGKLSTTIPTKENNAFQGWARSASAAEAEFAPGQNGVKFTTDMTLYAVWGLQFTVRFDANGGTVETDSITRNAGECVDYSEIIPDRDNYDYIAWVTDISATGLRNVPSDSKYCTASNMTLHAVWGKNRSAQVIIGDEQRSIDVYEIEGITDEIVRKKDEGEALSDDEQAIMQSQSRAFVSIASLEQPTRAGYVFAGWSRYEGATEAEYAPDADYLLQDGDIFFAVWTINDAIPDGGNPTPETPGGNPGTGDMIGMALGIFAGASLAGTGLFLVLKRRR